MDEAVVAEVCILASQYKRIAVRAAMSKLEPSAD